MFFTIRKHTLANFSVCAIDAYRPHRTWCGYMFMMGTIEALVLLNSRWVSLQTLHDIGYNE